MEKSNVIPPIFVVAVMLFSFVSVASAQTQSDLFFEDATSINEWVENTNVKGWLAPAMVENKQPTCVDGSCSLLEMAAQQTASTEKKAVCPDGSCSLFEMAKIAEEEDAAVAVNFERPKKERSTFRIFR